MAGQGIVNFGGSSQLALSFAGTDSPSYGTTYTQFWNSNHTWVIADNSPTKTYPTLGALILNGSYSIGSFSLQGDLAGDLVLNYTSTAEAPRTLYWSVNGSAQLVNGSGTWNNAGITNWTSLSSGSLSFDSSRPDNAVFGNANGSGGTAIVTVSGAVTVGSMTFNGSNSAQYEITGSAGTLTIINGVTANQSASFGAAHNPYPAGGIYLGGSQTWSVSSGCTLNVRCPIYQTAAGVLTKTGGGILQLYSRTNYNGTTISQGEISMQAADVLPTYGSSQGYPLAMAANTLLETNSYGVIVGALSGSGSIDLGSVGGGLTFGDATSQNYGGVIYGTNPVTYVGGGTSSLTGSNTFLGTVSITGGGELQVASDAGLGNSSNNVTINDGSTLGATASFSSTQAITLGTTVGSNAYVSTLDTSGSATVLTLNGQVTGGTLTKVGQGMLVLGNSANSYTGGTVLSTGTISIGAPGCIGSGEFTFLGTTYNSTLQFSNSMTLTNSFNFPETGNKPVWFNTQGYNVTLSGQLIPASTTYYSVDMYKTGSGVLNLAGPNANYATLGYLYVEQGTVMLSSDVVGYSAISSSPVVVAGGATLQLANVLLGYNSENQSGATGALGTLDLISSGGGATLKSNGAVQLRQRKHRDAVEL